MEKIEKRNVRYSCIGRRLKYLFPACIIVRHVSRDAKVSSEKLERWQPWGEACHSSFPFLRHVCAYDEPITPFHANRAY